MKKIIALIAVLGLLLPGIPVFAAERGLTPYSVDVTTYPITEDATMAAQIAHDVVSIHHIIITNSDATVAQTVTFYENAASTTTVTSAFAFDIASTSASGYVEPIQIPFPIPSSALELANPCIRKSSLISDVKVTIFYR